MHSRDERARLLSAVSDQLLEQGLSGATLSAIAKTVGSSNRMLLYYFNSKDELFSAASLEIYARFPRLVHLMDNLDAPMPLPARLEAIWTDLSHNEGIPFLRFFFEAFGVASHHPEHHQSFLDVVNSEWPPAVSAALRREGYSDAEAEIITVQVFALWRGLQFALVSGAEPGFLNTAHASAITKLLRTDATSE